MTCEQAIEMLPWYLNGTLEAKEKEDVRHHLAACEACRKALAETREAWRIFDPHLSPEALVDLAWGRPPAGIDPKLADRHLASCPQCAAELELARMSHRLEEDDRIAVFPPARPRSGEGGSRTWRAAALAAGLAGLLVAGGWYQSTREVRRLQVAIARQQAPVQAVPPAAPPPAPRDPGPQQRIAQLEAEVRQLREDQEQLGERAGELQTLLAQAQRAPRGLTEPQINTWTDDLVRGDVVRGEGDEGEIAVPAGVLATTTLPAERGETPREREVVILDTAGRTVWRKPGLVRNPETDDYTLTFPPGFLRPGSYTIQLYSDQGGRRALRETYRIRVH